MSPSRIAAAPIIAGLLAACGPGRASPPATPAASPANVAPALAIPSVDASALGSVRAGAYVVMTAGGWRAGKLDLEISQDGADLDALAGRAVTLEELPATLAALLADPPAEEPPPEDAGEVSSITSSDDASNHGGLLGDEVGGHGGFTASYPADGTCVTTLRHTDPEGDAVLLIAEAMLPATEVAALVGALPYSVALVAHAEDPGHGRSLSMIANGAAVRAEGVALLVVGAGTARLSLDDGATALWSGSGAAAIAAALRAESAARPDLRVQAALRLEPGATTQDLVTAIAGLDAADVGEIVLLDAPTPCGWGALGTGIGVGYGVGGGGGGGEAPAVHVGQPQVTGDLDKAIIRRYVKRNIAKIRSCYEQQLAVSPGLEGIATSEFTIGPDGQVSAAVVANFDPEVGACLEQVLLDIEFPAPSGGGSVHVVYPFVFRAAD